MGIHRSYSLRMLSTNKIDHILIVRIDAKPISEHCASSGTKKITLFKEIYGYDYISRIGKNLFFIRLRTLCNFLDEKPNLATCEGRGGGEICKSLLGIILKSEQNSITW